MANNIKIFIDHVGHTIVADVLEENAQIIKAKNPAVLIANPNANGQLTVQLVPLFFKEFVSLSVRENGAVFNYPADRIVQSEIVLEERLVEQYVGMFTPAPKPENKETPVIKLFDE
jgi:hypothetical protein